MQEYVENRSIALTVRASKLTARALAKILEAALRQIQKQHRKAQTPQGRQSVRKLMNHRTAVNTIPLDGNTRLFDRVARKWNVDYSFRKTGPKKYLLLFKSGQADAITACFSDYTRQYMARARDRRLPIHQQLRAAMEQARAQKPREHERTREAARDER